MAPDETMFLTDDGGHFVRLARQQLPHPNLPIGDSSGYSPTDYSHGFEAVVANTGSNQNAGYEVPAPPIGHGLPGILAVAGVLFGAGLMERGKKDGSFGVPRAG
jgi:hypothetical protein